MSKIHLIILAAVMLVLAAIAAPAQTSQPSSTPAKAPLRVSSSDQQKKLSKKVDPVYPKEAFDAKMTGVINLETTIGVDGKVTNVRLIGKGDDLLVKAAMDAVKQWVYKTTKDKDTGMPVEVITIVQINFKVGEE